MSSRNRRAAGRRRAWGRGPIILRFEPLEGRALLSGLPDMVSSSFTTSTHNADWGSTIQTEGTVYNQGNGSVNAPVQVVIYASGTPQVTHRSVEIGQVTLPAGLAPGQSTNFSQTVTLPGTPVPGFGASGQVYIVTSINPAKTVPESNYRNDKGLGVGYDTSVIAITPQQPALLQGASLNVTPNPVTWGGTLQLTAQIRNNAQGAAPPTVARIVLTPAGTAPGGISDVTIGTIDVPAVPAWQTVNVQGSITLPALPPPSLVGSQNYTLTLVPDSTFQTSDVLPQPAPLGLGKDQVSLQIQPNPATWLTQPALPDLAAGALTAPAGPLYWGSAIPVAGTVENIGQADVSAPINVRFVLVGPGGTTGQSLYLGSVTLDNGLKAGTSQQINQTLNLPSRVPYGLTIGSPIIGRVEMIIDPNNTIPESFETNNTSFSAPFVMRIPGDPGTFDLPTYPAVSTTPGTAITNTVVPTGKTPRVRITANGQIVRRNLPAKSQSTTDKVVHGLTAFPGQVNKFVKNVIKNDL